MGQRLWRCVGTFTYPDTTAPPTAGTITSVVVSDFFDGMKGSELASNTSLSIDWDEFGKFVDFDSIVIEDSYGEDGEDSYGEDSYGEDSYGEDSYGEDHTVKTAMMRVILILRTLASVWSLVGHLVKWNYKHGVRRTQMILLNMVPCQKHGITL